jgi:indolepyruvate ferredoxin oxidoreductase beta subunit
MHPNGQKEKKMKQDIILAGVGGQGILLMARALIQSARKQGLQYKQSEIHGMSQRGGPVYSHLRLSEGKIWSDLIPKAAADIVIGIEPMEALRYASYLSQKGMIITSNIPVKSIPNYPEVDLIINKIKSYERHIFIDTERLAKKAGSSKSQNMVIVGAASHNLMIEKSNLIKAIKELFSSKDKRIIDVNLKAFEYGREAAAFYQQCLEAGINPDYVYLLSLKRDIGSFDNQVINEWKDVVELDKQSDSKILQAIKDYDGIIPVNSNVPQNIKNKLKSGLSIKEIQEIIASGS